MWYYQYAVEWYCEVDSEEMRDNGILAAENYEAAVGILNKVYGDKNIEQMWLQPLTDDVLVFHSENSKMGESFKEYLMKVEDIDYEIF